MRKKIIALFSFFILIFSISFSAYAATPTQQIEYLSDGSYIEMCIRDSIGTAQFMRCDVFDCSY